MRMTCRNNQLCRAISQISILTPSLRSFTRSTTANSLGSIFVLSLAQSQYKSRNPVCQTYHFVNVFCWTVIHFCCSAKAILVSGFSCGGSMAFNPWSTGRFEGSKLRPLFFLNKAVSSVFVVRLALLCNRFVNCLDLFASLCNDDRLRRPVLGGGDGGKSSEGVLTGVVAREQVASKSPYSLGGGVSGEASADIFTFFLFLKSQTSINTTMKKELILSSASLLTFPASRVSRVSMHSKYKRESPAEISGDEHATMHNYHETPHFLHSASPRPQLRIYCRYQCHKIHVLIPNA